MANNTEVAARPSLASTMYQNMYGTSSEGSGMLLPVLHDGDGNKRPMGSFPPGGVAAQLSAVAVARAMHGGTGQGRLCGAAGLSDSRPISVMPAGGSAGRWPMAGVTAAKRKVAVALPAWFPHPLTSWSGIS